MNGQADWLIFYRIFKSKREPRSGIMCAPKNQNLEAQHADHR
jgi:hypothetical protein